MYAIIKTGGKQYRVQAGDTLQVEKLDADLGSEVTIHEVLMLGGDKSLVGTPLVKDASVTAVVTKQARTMKVYVFKKKRRQSYRRFGTHKQSFTELFITSISTPDGKAIKAEGKPVVKDMDAIRKERIQLKIEDSRARAEASVGLGATKEKTGAPTTKKKAEPKKKTAKIAAKKAATAKKAPSKRSTKTAAKKSAKKVAKKK